jgi:hypothetical protein
MSVVKLHPAQQQRNMVIFLWVLAILAAVARYWLVAAVMCVAAIAVSEWRKYSARTRVASSDSPTKESSEVSAASEGDSDVDYDQSFGIDLTDEHLEKTFGWNRWTLHPAKNRLISSFCGGGPPTFVEVWECRVDERSVFVRLLESSEEEFEGQRYSVFDNKIVPIFFEEKKKRMHLLAGTINGDKKRGEQMVQWTNANVALGPLLTYFILGHCAKNDAQRAFIRHFMHDEIIRLTDGFRSIERAADKLGAIWNAEYSYYEVPEGATDETRKTINGTLATDEGLLQFGITAAELGDKRKIMEVLSGFLTQG